MGLILNTAQNMQTDFTSKRAWRLVQQIVEKLKLDLGGLNVLTEAGSNNFVYTPFIAYAARAAKIFVWTKDTSFGQAAEISSTFLTIVGALGLDEKRFVLAVNQRPVEHISQADVITNLGSVRPLNKNLLTRLKREAVISYMCEAWEVRPGDVDIEFCRERGIPLAGVWENHPDLMIFSGCGPLSAKLCFEAGMEVYQNNILVLSGDKFGKVALETFRSMGAASVTVLAPELLEETDLSGYDFLFIADYSSEAEIIGPGLGPKLEQLRASAVVHLCGAVDAAYLAANGVFCYPRQQGKSKKMTRTLAHLGLKPVIDLHAAGLKVGECLFKQAHSDLVQTI